MLASGKKIALTITVVDQDRDPEIADQEMIQPVEQVETSAGVMKWNQPQSIISPNWRMP